MGPPHGRQGRLGALLPPGPDRGRLDPGGARLRGSYEPYEGTWYITGTHQDSVYRRLTRTIDLSAVTAAQAPILQARIAYSTELGYDHVLLEAHTAGAEDWTTLPDKNGRTRTTVPTECSQGYFLDMHPFLGHYLTGGNPCGNTGSSGAWNSFTGSSGGWARGAALGM